jgi:hypothetical protein
LTSIIIDPVPGFEGCLFPYNVYDAKTATPLCEGVIEVGTSVTLPIANRGRCRVSVSLPGRSSVQKASRAVRGSDQKVEFSLARELEPESRMKSAVAAPSVLLSPAGSDLFGPGNPLELSTLGPDPFLQENPFSRDSPSRGGTSFIPISTGGGRHRSFVVNRSFSGRAVRPRPPSVPYTLRPFVRLWKFSTTGSWSVDPDSVERVTDLPDTQRSVQILEDTRFCLEVGSPGGPNHFVHFLPDLYW